MTRWLLAGVSLAAFACPAWAQDSAEPAAEASSEIVVTAQKREQRLIDVPASLEVTTGETLQALNLNSATDLLYTTPGLGLGDSNTARGAGFRVRGVGTQIFADGIEQSVGVVQDGVPLSRAGQGFSDLIDVERVEVLRGPQGMLFGRNASAGVINTITKDPSSVFTADGIVSYGTDDDIRGAATLSGPVWGDRLKLRGTGFYNAQDGFVRNLATGDDLNNRQEYGFRGVATLQILDNLDFTLRGDWSQRNNQANIWTIRQLSETSPLLPLLDPGVVADVGPENDTVDLSGRIFNDVTNWGGVGEFNYTIAGHTITSITGYRRWFQKDNNDADQSAFNVLDLNVGSNNLFQTSQEFRITSPEEQRLRYVGGFFYFHNTNRNESIQVGRFAAPFALAQAFGVSVPLAPGVTILPGDLGGRRVNIEVDVRDLAGFGQLELDLTEKLVLIAGARINNTRVQGVYDRSAGPGTGPLFNAILGASFAPLSYDLTTRDTAFLWRGGLQYHPTPDQNLYFTASRGYKGPGFDTQVDFTLQPGRTAFDAAVVAPEVPTNYEIGYKGGFFERKLDVSVSLYRTNFEDFQAQVFERPEGAILGSFRVRNAGQLRSQGFEAAVNVRPLRDLTAGVSIAYNDAEFTDFEAAACPLLRATVTEPDNGRNCGLLANGASALAFDASGQDQPNAPKWTVSFNGRYDRELNSKLKLFIQPNILFRDRITFGLYPDNIPNPTTQESVVILNMSAGLASPDERWSLAFYAKNLTDENFVTSIFDLPFGGPGDLGQFVTRDAQRTVGVQLGLHY